MDSLNQITDIAPTQRDRLITLIDRLKTDITPADRSAAIKELKISEPTLKRYLTGFISNNDKAVEIINFFKQRIKKRDELIAA